MGFIDDVLTAVERVSNSDALQYGRKGMKWGVTTNPDGTTSGTPQAVTTKQTPGKKVKTAGGKGAPASEDAVKAAVGKQIAKKSSTDALSNAELQAVVQRMQLEANYKRLTAETKGPGKKFISAMLTNKKQRDSFLTTANAAHETLLARQVGDAITKTKL